MDCGCLHFRLNTKVLVHSKGRSQPPKFRISRCNPQLNLSSLDSLKQSCNGAALELKLRIPSEKLHPVRAVGIRCDHPQNADLPRYYSRKEKKPFPIPIVELRRAARDRMKNRLPKRRVPPPKIGLVIKSLVPAAYNVFNARMTMINNLKRLMKVVTVNGCKWCNEIHVGPVGHPFKSCRGSQASQRKGHHEWGKAVVEDIIVPLESYHLYDRLGKRISHEERFSIPRIPAVVELCIQAGVDLPEYPTKRRRKPIIWIGKNEFVDADESDLPDPEPDSPTPPILTEIPNSEVELPSSTEETILLAEETLVAWEKMRAGANKLMKMYPVRVCGYCPELHVGPSGHKAQNCGAHKHQQRNGQHGWQTAVLDDLIPPRYVWHVPDVTQPLQRELRSFYGQAPAVVEICVQAGAEVPEQYKPTMRFDVGIPSSTQEAEMVVCSKPSPKAPQRKMATSAVDGGAGGEDIKFSVMVSLFQWIQKSKSSAQKRSKFRKFLDTFCRKPQDNFAAMRLILPGLDRERGSYGLKEHVLSTCLIDALAMSRDSDDARRLFNWRKGGPKTGSNAGNFSLVAAEVLQRRQGMASAGLTIKELNDFLDHLASSENRAEKTSILSDLIRKTNAQEMKWIIMIILKDLKLGISEKSIFREYHPDAEDLFNVTCDLKLVSEKLRDRSQRHKRQDIEVGKPVRPQLALRVSNASAAWKKLHGKEVVVECKFDGDRIQIHKNNSELNFFSRNFLDHQEYAHGMSDVITKNILADKCILDGEMLVWDASINRFAEFGSNQEIAKAAREGLDSDRQLCYVAFDILYVGDTSVIHRSLKERQEILQKVVNPIKGRLEILVPNGGLNAHRLSGEPRWSIIARSVDDVDKFFTETVENRDEGIVLKDLSSKWEPSDRSGKWLKLKPDYVQPGSDLDVLIIGGYYGSGRHGGEVAQFLVGLAEPPSPNTYPRRFISFCRVGTGVSDEERNTIVTRLKPYFRKYDYPKQAAPTFYQVTNNAKERPDVWVESPEKSIIVSITSDIRTIRTEVFAAPYSLRFPRIDKVRYDKPWHECLDVQSFVDLVHSTNGTTQRGADYGVGQDHEPKTIRSPRKREKKNVSAVPSHFVQTDVSQIKGDTSMLSDMVFYFANVPSSHSLESLHKMVVEHGGSFSMNLNKSVTHCIAAESRGIKFQAAKLHGDVIQCSWLFDCCLQKKLLPLQPKYFLFLSDSTKKKMEAEVDEYSDSFYSDLGIEEIKLLLRNVEHSEDSKSLEYYKRKYCPNDKWARFHGCCIYFFIPKQCLEYSDCKALVELAMRRMKVEISVGGGKVGNNLFHATHVVVMSLPEFNLNFNEVLNSFSETEKHALYNKKLHVVGAEWLEDSFKEDQKLLEESYCLKPSDFQVSISEKRRSSSPDKHGVPIISDQCRAITLRKRNGKRDRGRPTGSAAAKGKMGFNMPRRVKRKVTSSRAKIHENESDESATSGEHHCNDEIELAVGTRGSHEIIAALSSGIQKEDDVQDPELSPAGETLPPRTAECSVIGGRLDEAHETSYGSGNMVRGKDKGKDKVDEKLEDPVDPVQAMLLHMIPHLESKPTRSVDTLVKADKPEADTNSSPKKKKKVSYKDVAGELLKDW